MQWYKPMFQEGASGLILQGVPVPLPDPYSNFFHRWHRWLTDHSYFYAFLARRLRYSRLNQWAIRFSAIPFPEELQVWHKKPGPEMAAAWRKTELLLDLLYKRVKSAKSEWMIFYVPPFESVDPEAWAMIQKRYGIAGGDWDPRLAEAKLEGICLKRGWNCLNPRAVYESKTKELAGEGRGLYYPRDGHWTPEGNRLAGQILAEFISGHFTGAEKP